MERLLSLSLFTLILLSPLYVIRWSYFGILPTTLLELLILVFCGVWVLWRVKRKDFSLPKTEFVFPILTILFASILSIFVSSDRVAALGIARAYFWEPIIVFLLITDMKKDELLKEKINKSILFGGISAGIWLALLGIAQALFGMGIVTPHQIDRAHGVFNNGNALALFLGPLIASSLGILVEKFKEFQLERKKAILISGILIVLVCAFFLSQSLGGILALVGVVGVLLFTRYIHFAFFNKDTLLRLLVIGTFFISFFLMFFSNNFAPDVDNPWVRQGGTALTRLCLWQGSGHLIQDNWLLGVGLSGFKETYSQNYVTCDAEPLEYPHNFFMALWSELGLLGLIGTVWLIWRVSAKLKGGKYSLSVLLALTYILIHGVVDVSYFKNDLSLQFWMFLVLII